MESLEGHNSWQKRILRVFPRRTSYTPSDPLVYISNGSLQIPILQLLPEFDEVHISCVFTWDKQHCRELERMFRNLTNKPVYLGGPAFGSDADDFTPGLYLKKGVIFTSRGCNNNCPWCIVPKIEGKLKELPIIPGNIIQDNNFLQTSRQHKEKVFKMLKGQKQICFKGGLEASLINDDFIESIKDLRIKELWLACDRDSTLPAFKKACQKLVEAGYTRKKIKCYVLINDDKEKSEARLRAVYSAGATPFAQLYRDFTEVKTQYSKDVERFARQWQRPPAIYAHMERNTDYREYRT